MSDGLGPIASFGYSPAGSDLQRNGCEEQGGVLGADPLVDLGLAPAIAGLTPVGIGTHAVRLLKRLSGSGELCRDYALCTRSVWWP